MKLAIAQMDILWLNLEGNKAKFINFFEKARERNIELIVFPEMTFTGFYMNAKEATHLNKNIMDFVKENCIKYGLNCVFGLVEDCLNKCITISNNGMILSSYSKIHPFSYSGENIEYHKGNSIESFSLNGMKFSTFICYDLRFPEIFQAVSNTVDCIIIIANWPEKRQKHWDVLLKARAIENQTYIIGCNRVGVGDNLNYIGGSTIISPIGDNIILEYDEETLLTCNIEKTIVDNYRVSFPTKIDRQIELYRNYYI